MKSECEVKKRLNSEKKIVEKLVNTRKIIENKFKKAQKERANREKDLKDKYRPITSAIEKFVEGQPQSRQHDAFTPRPYQPDYSDNDTNHMYDSIFSGHGSDSDDWSDSSEYSEDQVEAMDTDFLIENKPPKTELEAAGPSSLDVYPRKRAAHDDDVDTISRRNIVPMKRTKANIDLERLKKLKNRRRKLKPVKKRRSRVIRPRSDDEVDIDDVLSYSDDENDILVAPNNRKKCKLVKSFIAIEDKKKNERIAK